MTRVYLKSLTTLLNSGSLHPTLLLPGKGNYSDISGNLRKKVTLILTSETIYPSGSQPARIYGLPKMHKPRRPNSTPPFRPIVSSIGTYNYSLAKYLSNLRQPHIPSTFIASDSFTFVKEINDLSLHGMFMVSFDVESLFTNIPLDDCINTTAAVRPQSHTQVKTEISADVSIFETGLGRFGPAIFAN